MYTREQNLKYIVKTDKHRTYSLYIMEATEYEKGKFVALFLYYDNGDFDSTEKLWLNLRHRILYENSIDAVISKITEYGEGRNETYSFMEMSEPIAV